MLRGLRAIRARKGKKRRQDGWFPAASLLGSSIYRVALVNLKQASAGFLEQRYGEIALLHHLGGDLQLLDFLVAGQVIHQVQHQFFEDHAQAACAYLAIQRFDCNSFGGIRRKFQLNAFVLKQPLILLENRITRLGEDLDQRGFVELIEQSQNRQTADEFGYKAELDQVLWLRLAQQFGIALAANDEARKPLPPLPSL